MTDSISADAGSGTVEPDGLDDLGEARRQNLLDAATQFHSAACRLIGRPVDLDSGQDLQRALFEELGLPPTPGYAIDTGALYALRDKHPHMFLTYLLAYRAIRAVSGAVR